MKEGMRFCEGKIKEEKVFGGVVFPKTLHPLSKVEAGSTNLCEIVKDESEHLVDLLHRHGAILFRGFNVGSAADFDSVVEAFGWEHMEFFGAVTRLKVTDRVFTANEASPDQLINFHHEMSLATKYPSKVFFFCDEPPAEGGATSIVLSHVVVDQMEKRLPEVTTKVSKVGFIYRRRTARDDGSDSGAIANKPWKCMLKTEDEAEADKRAKDMLGSNSVAFNEDGSAEFVYGPVNPIREFGGKKALFFPLIGFTGNIKEANSSYGDGTKFSMEDLTTYRDILEENCVDVKWQKGDVLLLDNHAVQHARRPGTAPRRILASICK